MDRPTSRAAVPSILRDVAKDELALRFERCLDSVDLPSCLGADLDPIASVLERAAIDPSVDVSSPNVMNFATALRIYGPREVRRGEDLVLEWKELSDGSLLARDHRGTRWDIVGGGESWGVIIADWDRPDWYVESLELAKSLVAEIVARPSFPRELMEEIGEMEIPFD
ncbi:MAG: hypothetical protein U0R51_01570 [Solirubrobacterales bacterium]